MATASAKRRENFDILQEGIFNMYVDDNLDLFERQAASIMNIYDVARDDYSYASGYFHLCTAFGKSYLIKAMAMSYNAMQSGKKIIVLEENQSVVKQMARELTVNSSLKPHDVGMFFAESKDTDTPVIVCTYASMKKMIERVGRENIGLVLCDEAHHILSENRQNVAREFADCALYGFTATSDYGIQDKNCATVFGPVIDSVTVRDGIERDGLLCSTKTGLFLSNIPVDLTRAIALGHDDYDPAILDELLRASHVDGLRRGLADWYLYGADDTIGTVFGKQTIINVPSIAEAERVAREFNTAAAEKGLGPIARAYHTKTSDSILDEFNAGRFPVLVQVNKISEGYNNPNVAICINYPTHSMVRSIQRSGRALRFNPNDPNKCALVMDIAFARRAPDEGEKDVLSAIYENGQRLFYDVLGTVQCMNPADKRTSGDGKQSENPRPRESVALPSMFRVVTSVEFTNVVLEHRANNLDVEIKTSEWLTAYELAGKYIIGKDTKIRKLLQTYQDIMPEYIKNKLNASGQYVLCLHRDAIDKFCEITGSRQLDAAIGEKTDEWLNANELHSKYVGGSAARILRSFEKYKDIMPNDIQLKRKANHVCLCLRRNAISKFCELSGLKYIDKTVDKKADDWLTAKELAGKYIIGDKSKIIDMLNKYQSAMPKDIQTKRNNMGRLVLCLYIGAVDKFCELSGMIRASDRIKDKTSDWLNVVELSKNYVRNGSNIVRNAIEQYRKIKPEHVQLKRSGVHVIWSLNRGAIGEFCELFGLNLKNPEIGKKTKEWLGARDLAGKYFVGSADKVRDKLEQLRMSMPEHIKFRQNGGKITICLHRDGIDKFYNLSGLRRVDKTISEKTQDWLSAVELGGKHISVHTTKLKKLMEQYQTVLPEYIQLRRSGTLSVLCLRRDAIEKFCNIAGLLFLDGNIGKKTPDWFGVNELKSIHIRAANSTVILRAMEKYENILPNYIQKKRNGSKIALYLHRDGINQFCKLSGLQQKSILVRPDNTNDR